MGGDVVRTGGLTGYRRLLRNLGHDPDALLADVGIRASDMNDPDRYVSYQAVIRAIEAPADRFGLADFGMRLAAFQDISIIGPLAFAMQNAISVYDGMRQTADNIWFQSPNIRLSIEDDPNPDCERICFDIALANPIRMRQAIEHAVGMIFHTVALVSSGSVIASAVSFRHERQGPRERYLQHLKMEPAFDADWNGVQINRKAFRTRLPQRSRLLTEYARQFVQLRAPRAQKSIEDMARDAIREIMRIHPATLAEVARLLGMHPRTLQQRLSAASTTFEQLRDEVRRDFADTYLAQPNISLAHVASLLGYSEQSVLNRSCKRWFGHSPRARRQILSGPQATS